MKLRLGPQREAGPSERQADRDPGTLGIEVAPALCGHMTRGWHNHQVQQIPGRPGAGAASPPVPATGGWCRASGHASKATPAFPWGGGGARLLPAHPLSWSGTPFPQKEEITKRMEVASCPPPPHTHLQNGWREPTEPVAAPKGMLSATSHGARPTPFRETQLSCPWLLGLFLFISCNQSCLFIVDVFIVSWPWFLGVFLVGICIFRSGPSLMGSW